MQLLNHSAGAAGQAGRRASRASRAAPPRAAYDYDEEPFASSGLYEPAGAYGPEASRRTEAWLKTPVDLLTFGPRLTAGVLLSLPQLANNAQIDLERAQLLAQDPRPMAEKQEEALGELDFRVAELVERGRGVEADLLGALGAALPPDVLQQLPKEFRDLMEREIEESAIVDEPADTDYFSAAAVPNDLVATQTASELAEVREAVAGLRSCVAVCLANEDPSKNAVLGVNVAEARALLARRLQELSPLAPADQDPSVKAAVEEANLLLEEIADLRF